MQNRALSIKEILPLPTNRAFICGTTGSGKTYLAKEMLRWRRHVLILDSKGLITWPGYERHTTLKTLFRSKAERIVYRPTLEESEFDRIELFFKWSYLRRNHTLYIDESNAVTTATYIPYYLKGIITRGRELKIECWASTQRPVGINTFLFSEAEHGYFFKIKAPQDIARIEETFNVSGEAVFKLRKKQHKFYYANAETGLVIGPTSIKTQE